MFERIIKRGKGFSEEREAMTELNTGVHYLNYRIGGGNGCEYFLSHEDLAHRMQDLEDSFGYDVYFAGYGWVQVTTMMNQSDLFTGRQCLTLSVR